MSTKFLAAVACVTALLAGPALADSTLSYSQTAGLLAQFPDQTCPQGQCFGGFLTVNFSDESYNYGLLQFDLSSVAAPVGSATLQLSHIFNTAEATFGLFQVTQAWDMNTATFNTAPTLGAEVASFTTGSGDHGGDTHSVDVTGIVNSWIGGAENDGLALIRTDGTNPFIYFSASDSGCCGGQGPRLVLTDASAAPEPAAWALMLAGFGLAGAGLRGARRRNAALA